ncbi:MAG: excinuclease ABC subunit UvrB [Peptococcaceae bacterium]|jgi:excinuclease ABC subunit B|nr:excinuclease ABC subunit UvrB [Peptococcaceae bacterium]
METPFEPCGDQPGAIARLSEGLEAGLKGQVLLGVTGSGKTYTMARVIERLGRPALVLAPNKTLAAQLCGEFKSFFPHNAVEYFVSYYDYYQPEAYIPQTDTYIEKDSSINDEIDKLRHSATCSLFERRDVIIVASVSCIYGLGDPGEYRDLVVSLREGATQERQQLLRRLVDIQYTRNETALDRGSFRARGEVVEIFPAGAAQRLIRVELAEDRVERLLEVDSLTGEIIGRRSHVSIFPASHYATSRDRLLRAVTSIEAELVERLAWFRRDGRLLEAQRLETRTLNDIEMMREIGFCQGIENYSRHLTGRAAGQPPYTLLDYFPPDFLLFVDESHIAVPQVRGMYEGDRSRKNALVDHGFRLPSAFDNRPLTFDEFMGTIGQVVYVSATPGPFELDQAGRVVEQIIRPTGLVDPGVVVRPTRGQVDDLLDEIRFTVNRGERVLITTLTKRMAEDLTGYLAEAGVRVRYLHSDIHTLERLSIIRDLRLGTFDVLVGINLLREGLDLPEVSLIAILDADKEGYLRSERSLIQTIGRASRNVNGRVILYADSVTGSMDRAMKETERRRTLQVDFNRRHGITPRTVQKEVREVIEATHALPAIAGSGRKPPASEIRKALAVLEEKMRKAAKELAFEDAARYRDMIIELKLAQKGRNSPVDEAVWDTCS